ncbi:MAG: methyltransferase domain-containing protein [Acidimicrobiia bacterium]|nr:methyltransferase domain-containing protein [Acidimicrobiia bacterium]
MSTIPSLAVLGDVVAAYQAGTAGDAEAAKSCCAVVYGIDLVGLFLGESYHPGGVELTRRLAELLALEADHHVLDVASGVGTTAVLLAAERRACVVGIDLGAAQVARAATRATAAGVADRVRFEVGDAERLPFDDGTFDVLVSECAFCTFPDKPTAAREAARVLRPGGRLGLTDVWLHPDRLEPDLSNIAGRIACIADARPIPEVRALLEAAGLRVDHVERHDDVLAATVELVATRLRALRLLDLPLLRSFDLRRAIDITRSVGDVVARGDAGYLALVATKP